MSVFDNPGDVMMREYPARPFLLKHHLANDPRFSLPSLIELARRLPPKDVEYNSGDLPIEQDPSKTPATGLSVEESIRRIEEMNSWMVLGHVEQDPQYNEALEECLAEIAPYAAPATGPMYKTIGFIFISSANATTPLHMDPEHNILIHLRGAKRMTIYPNDIGMVPDDQHERYHAGAAHRNLVHRPEFDAAARAFDLSPGDAVHVPVKAPHWVRTGAEPCISFSITWRSRASDAEARLRIANHHLRRMGGAPPAVGTRPWRDAAAIFAHRAIERLARPFAPRD